MHMIKFISLWLVIMFIAHAEFTKEEAAALAKKATKVRQELGLDKKKLTKREKEIEAIRKELNLPTSLTVTCDTSVNTVTLKKSILPEDSSTIIDTIESSVDNITNLVSNENKESSSLYESFGLHEGEYLGLPSIFGLNEKKNHTLFSDIVDTGHSIYKGFKYSGQSAEFTSGMMYKSSKMYNTMFGMFGDSPLNIFEDKDENSIFDVFEKGNELLDIVD